MRRARPTRRLTGAEPALLPDSPCDHHGRPTRFRAVRLAQQAQLLLNAGSRPLGTSRQLSLQPFSRRACRLRAVSVLLRHRKRASIRPSCRPSMRRWLDKIRFSRSATIAHNVWSQGDELFLNEWNLANSLGYWTRCRLLGGYLRNKMFDELLAVGVTVPTCCHCVTAFKQRLATGVGTQQRPVLLAQQSPCEQLAT